MKILQKTFKANSIIFKQGDLGTEMFVVAAGAVDIYAINDGVPTTIATIASGEIFGEMALVASGQRRSAFAKAVSDTELICINESHFVYLVSQQPAFALSILRTMATRITKLNEAMNALSKGE